MALPPGQRAVDGFPRFGTHLHRPPPAMPAEPSIEVAGAVRERLPIPLEDLAGPARRSLTADFHCVAGWTATGLEWEGVPFAALYRERIEPLVAAEVTHFVFGGLDGYRAIVSVEDALAGDVLIADRLHGRPLGEDHGAPVRLLSPSQYGYVSVKHLCRIEVRTGEPDENFGAASRTARALMIRPLFSRHPRSRVWHEERNGTLPNWLVRPLYRALTPPLRWLCSRGASDHRP